MANAYIPIGKLFNVQKGQLQSTKCTPGEFDFITAAEDWKTHESFEYDCEALIFAAAASGSLGRTHYVDGKFVSSDLCYILTPKDEQIYPLNLAFYHFVFNSLRSLIVKATKSGTSKESINQSNFNKFELPYFDIEQQDLWISKLKDTLVRKDLIVAELGHQKSLLEKLRQRILQDAMEGNLTAKWRIKNHNVESAHQLLESITAERMQFIQAKKIKPQKPLSPVTNKEKTFELPDRWQWCRFGEYALFERGKFSIRPRNDTSCFGGKYPFIQIGALNSSGSLVDTYKQTLNEKGYAASKLFEKGTIMVAIVGGTIGNLGVLNREMCFTDSIVGVRPRPLTNQQYILLMLRHFQPAIKSLSYQMAGQPNIKLPTLNNLVCGLPPISEQNAIVARVEKLFALCNELEVQIANNQTQAEQLMQAVLKEAFNQSDRVFAESEKGAAYA